MNAAAVDGTLAALADPTRRGVVDLLRRRPRAAGELASALDVSPPALSRHLRVLRKSGLIEEERAALERLAEALTVPAQMPLGDAAGFALHEGLLSQAAAIHLDATHLKLKGDAELLFFHALASRSASGGRNDYTGRTRRLDYNVDPVLMLGGRVMVTYDFPHVRNAASLNAGFKTNRLFSAGGDVTYDPRPDSPARFVLSLPRAAEIFPLSERLSA